MVRQVDLAAAVECPRAARISNLVSFYKVTDVFRERGPRSGAREPLAPSPPPAEGTLHRFSHFQLS